MVGVGLAARSGLAVRVWVGDTCWVETAVTVVAVVAVVEEGLLDVGPGAPA